jgi:hypothetical protein
MRKQLGIAAVALAGLAAGAGAGFVLTGATDTAGASGSAAGASSTSAPATTAAPSAGQNGAAAKNADRTQRLKDILDPLVKNGTITQAQENAVIAAIEKAQPAFGRGGFGRFGHFGHFGDAEFAAAAKAIGVSADELRSALRSGQTIAQVAKAHNVAVSKVVDAMTAAFKQQLQTAVANGRITQAQANTAVAAAKDKITALVSGQMPAFRHPDNDSKANGPTD